MYSVFQEIEKLREGRSFQINEALTDRYTLRCQDTFGAKTAYCFSVPIRNINTNDIVDLKFYHNSRSSTFFGSEAKISVSDKIRFFNEYGKCDVLLPGAISKKTENAIFFKDGTSSIEIRPTLNGVILLFDSYLTSGSATIKLQFDRSYELVQTNNKYFSAMREKFIPFITASCIGMMNATGRVRAPCEVYNQKINDFEYILTFASASKSKDRIAVEINMQEPKLFQDTTVESNHPTTNNAFGGISFLGTSRAFGEQWLYSRINLASLALMQSKKITKSILHIPKLSCNTSPIAVYKMAERFCSFGSNWQNKIAITDTVTVATASNGYYHLDLTKLLGNILKKSESFVIRANTSSNPVIIPTGDSFYSPQIFEVTYH